MTDVTVIGGAHDPDCDIAGSTIYGCNSYEHTGACTSWGTCETYQYPPPPPPSPPSPPPPSLPPPPPSCTASTSPSADGSFGPFYCINGGTVSGLAPDGCKCQDCNPGFGGVNCADANACSASTDSTKTTGNDGEFWCINGGVIGGNAGGCTCTCGPGISGDHCQTRNACDATTDPQKRTGSDGTFWCINGGTIGGVTGSCTCTGCSKGYTGDHCQTATACTASSDESKTTGADGEFYCVNNGTIGGVTGSCTCTKCNPGYGGTNCATSGACSASAEKSKTTGNDGEYYCINGGIISGTSGSCQCICAGGYSGDHCQTANACTATTDESKKDGKDGEYFINGGTISGTSGSCQCTCAGGFKATTARTGKFAPTPRTQPRQPAPTASFTASTAALSAASLNRARAQDVTRAMKAITARRARRALHPRMRPRRPGATALSTASMAAPSRPVGSCTCTGCNTGYEGDHCQTAKPAQHPQTRPRMVLTHHLLTWRHCRWKHRVVQMHVQGWVRRRGCKRRSDANSATVTKKEEAEKLAT